MDYHAPSRVAASVAASYGSRYGLNPTVMERLLQSPIGRRLQQTGTGDRAVLEFLAYSLVAIAVEGGDNRTPLRTIIGRLAADGTTKLFEALHARGLEPEALRAALDHLSEAELAQLSQITIQNGGATSMEDQSSTPTIDAQLFQLLTSLDAARQQKLQDFLVWHANSVEPLGLASAASRAKDLTRFRAFLVQIGRDGLNRLADVIPDAPNEPDRYRAATQLLAAVGAPSGTPSRLASAVDAAADAPRQGLHMLGEAAKNYDQYVEERYEAIGNRNGQRGWPIRQMLRLMGQPVIRKKK